MADNTQNEIVTEAQVEEALCFLKDNAVDIGKAREAMIKAEKMTKHRQALLMRRYSHLPISAQEREARASNEYNSDSLEEARAAGEFEKMKALREHAAMTIEVWRSAGANYRAMKI